MNAIEQLKSVLCDQEGKCCIWGSDADRAIVDRALEELTTPQQAEAVPSDVVRDADVEAAAKKMAEIFDYPWDFMPEKGRNTMRENVRAVFAAAQGEKP